MGKKKNKKELLRKAIRRRKILLAVTVALFLIAMVPFVHYLIFCCSKADESSYVYAPFLKYRMKMWFAFCLFMFCLIWGGIIACVKLLGFEFFVTWGMICLALFLCAVFVIGFVAFRLHYLDFTMEDCVVYQGDFKKDHVRDFVFLGDGTRLWNLRNQTYLEIGDYSGTVVYSKRTKYVLAIELD